MKKLFAVVAVLTVAGLVRAALAADAPAPAKIHGKIVSVSDDGKITVKMGRGDTATEVVVTTDASTKVTLDDKDAKVSDLKKDMFIVKVVGDEGKPAAEVHATTKRPQRPAPPADPANPPQ